MATLVVNKLLMYVISKLDVDNVMDIKNVITTFYGEEAVNDAKADLWSAYTDTLDRPVNHRSQVKTTYDIVEAVQQIFAAYPDKDTLPVMFVALSTKNLPFICEKMPPSRDGFVESRLAALEMQMKDVTSHTSPSSFSVTTTHPRTYSACVDNSIQNKRRQQHHVPQPAQTVSLPDSFNNKLAYNTDFSLPSLTQTKHPAEHSAPQHGQTQQDPTNSGHAWNTVQGFRPRPCRPQAVYGTKQSDGLQAPPRGYD